MINAIEKNVREKKKENSGERAAFLYVEDMISDSELGSEQAGEGDSEGIRRSWGRRSCT